MSLTTFVITWMATMTLTIHTISFSSSIWHIYTWNAKKSKHLVRQIMVIW